MEDCFPTFVECSPGKV